jgi:hypothetical protein
MLKQKNICAKKLLEKKKPKKYYEWLKMSHIFISPYHNHFWVDFSFYFLNMYIKKSFRMDYFHMGFLAH